MRIIVTIIATIIYGQIFACGNAFQLRYFPIGISNDHLIVIETSLNRHWGVDTIGVTEDTKNYWKGIVTLKSINKKGQFAIIKFIDSVNFSDANYETELEKIFAKAHLIADKLLDFKNVDKQEIEFCNFNTDCKLVDLKIDTLTKKIALVTADSFVTEINYPMSVIDVSEQSGGISNQIFGITSIRKLTIGTNTLIVAAISSGELHNSELELKNEGQKQCQSPINCIYKEIVLYHGLSFDAIIWN